VLVIYPAEQEILKLLELVLIQVFVFLSDVPGGRVSPIVVAGVKNSLENFP
jgi:hypothetical protein